LHPYCWSDPLAPCVYQGGIGNLAHIRRVMRSMGVTVDFWLDEFGFRNDHRVGIGDESAAWLWPRAERQATRNHAKVLIAFTSRGMTWNTRPGPLAWCAMTQGRDCPTPEHRTPIAADVPPATVRHVDDADAMAQMLDYS
jgi:hypothetical protein